MRNKPKFFEILEDDSGSRACRFLDLHEALPKPGEVRIPSPPPKSDDKLLNNFKKVYARLPAAFKTKPPDLGSEVIKIGVAARLVDELHALVQQLKPKAKPTT